MLEDLEDYEADWQYHCEQEDFDRYFCIGFLEGQCGVYVSFYTEYLQHKIEESEVLRLLGKDFYEELALFHQKYPAVTEKRMIELLLKESEFLPKGIHA